VSKSGKPHKLKVLWVVNSKEELSELPDGEYEVVWTTRRIEIKGKKVVYLDDYPMQLRRTSDG
jgi:hypothetical protein